MDSRSQRRPEERAKVELSLMPDREQRLVSAIHLATQKLSSTASVEETLREVLQLCVNASGAFGGTIYIHDPVRKRLVFRHVVPEEVREKLQMTEMPDDSGVAGQVFQTRKPRIGGAGQESSVRSEIESSTGVSTLNMVTAPLMIADMDPIGVVQLVNKQTGDFDQSDLEVLDTLSAVSAMAYLNSKLAEDASRAASLTGMGKVSHDIGNLAGALHANLTYLDATICGMTSDEKTSAMKEYGNAIGDAINDLRESIDVIVGYSRLISNLSAGKEVTPEKRPGNMAETVANAAAFLESQARRSQIAVRYQIENLGEKTMFDHQFLHRIVQNLVGNGIKATLESIPKDFRSQSDDDETILGEVTISYRVEDNDHVLEVRDTGPGMTPDVVTRILEGTATSRWSSSIGSGWGTKIVKELSAAHGGSIEVESEPGTGTLFRVRLPREKISETAAV